MAKAGEIVPQPNDKGLFSTMQVNKEDVDNCTTTRAEDNGTSAKRRSPLLSNENQNLFKREIVYVQKSDPKDSEKRYEVRGE